MHSKKVNNRISYLKRNYVIEKNDNRQSMEIKQSYKKQIFRSM